MYIPLIICETNVNDIYSKNMIARCHESCQLLQDHRIFFSVELASAVHVVVLQLLFAHVTSLLPPLAFLSQHLLISAASGLTFCYHRYMIQRWPTPKISEWFNDVAASGIGHRECAGKFSHHQLLALVVSKSIPPVLVVWHKYLQTTHYIALRRQ